MLKRMSLFTFVAAMALGLVGCKELLKLPKPNDAINPADFVGIVDNPYFPLKPGTTFVYEGENDDGSEHIEVVVTHDAKEILGVATTVVRDTVMLDGELVEDTYDWYAQDRDGNVWYFGEDSKTYENGVIISTEGSWEAGVNGARPGIIMEAAPKVGDVYRQEYLKGAAEDAAEVLSLNESVIVTYDSFDHVLKTKEWSPLDPNVIEHKYYAIGIGLVLAQAVAGESAQIQLISMTSS